MSTFDELLQQSFERFRTDKGQWETQTVGPREMIASFFLYMFRKFYDEQGKTIFPNLSDDFLKNARNIKGISLEGSDTEDVFPCLKIGIPSGRSTIMELGEASENSENNLITHQRWVGTVDILVRGRNNLEVTRLADIVEMSITGPLADVFRKLSIVMGSINSPKSREKKISNDIVAWELPITVNIELVTMGMVFDVMYNVFLDEEFILAY